MQWRIIDISETSKYLKVERGFIQVFKDKELIGHVALDELLGLIVSGYGHTFSVSLVNRLVEKNIAVVFCGKNQNPYSYCLPVQVMTEQSKRMISQAQVKIPIKKKIWKKIIQEKIKNQWKVSDILSLKCRNQLLNLYRSVKSGDTTNRESVAARSYWKHLFGKDFLRDRNAPGINGILNYGYTILRSCIARAVMGAGLHPTLGVHHKGPTNGMCLVDDLMEPFRPTIDYMTYLISQEYGEKLDKKIKSKMAGLAILDTEGERGFTPFSNAMCQMTNSLVKIFLKQETDFFIPKIPKKEVIKSYLK